LKSRYAAPGKEPWAVITGGALGIGRGYAQELAKEGFNIVIIDKNAQAMAKAQQELQGAGVKVKTLQYDFGKLGSVSEYESFEKQLENTVAGLDVCILANNAAEFQQQALNVAPVSVIFRASNVNCHAPAVLARYFLNKMLDRHSRGYKSAIINVGTCAAEIQNPRYQFAIYGASKSYLHILSSGMQEWYGDKIDIMTVVPRQTSTPMNPANFKYTITPETHAKAVVDQLGYEKQTYGAFVHDLEYQMRFNYTFGIFDQYVQWCNSTRNANLVKTYNQK